MSLALLTWSGVARKTVWLWLPFTTAENQILRFSNSWNHWKFREVSSTGELNVIRNSGCWRQGSVRTSEKCEGWERIRRNQLWKQKIMSRELNISTQSSRASSGTIYTWQRTSAQMDTSLLMLWRRSHGQEHSVSSSGTLRMGTKTSSSGRLIFHNRGAVLQPEQDLCSNVPWGAFWGCRDAITLPMSWFGERCPIRGWHIFIFARKEWNWCPSVSRGRATRSCETA